MAAIPLRREYAPTLGELLGPRWRAATRATRLIIVVAVVAIAAAVAAAVLTVVDATYAHGGAAPFHFRYRSIFRTTPIDGEFVRLEADGPHGSLENAFAVGPLTLPSYVGNVSAELPLFATNFITGLARRYEDFQIQAEGEERLNTTSGTTNPAGYEIDFSSLRGNEPIDGRVVLLISPHGDGRSGVEVTMLTRASSAVDNSHPVGGEGLLNLPFATLTFSG